MSPRMPTRVTLRNPGVASVDPATGNPRTPAVTETRTRAYLSQLPVVQLSAQNEIAGRQTTTVSSYTLLVPPAAPLTSQSVVIDEDGHRYEVVGDPAERRRLGRRVMYKAAALHRISDLQA